MEVMPMLLLYVSPTARYSRQASEWLRERGIRYQERNIFSSLLTREEFAKLCYLLKKEGKPLLSLFGITADGPIPLSEEECYRILCDTPHSLQRPILMGKSYIEIGFNEEKFENLLIQEKLFTKFKNKH